MMIVPAPPFPHRRIKPMCEDESREKVKVTVVDRHVYGSKVIDVISWLQGILEKIPEPFRREARIDIDAEDEWGSVRGVVEIYYLRPETDQEMFDRLKKLRQEDVDREHRERQELAALKAKYEG
jgi:hypothetical protein